MTDNARSLWLAIIVLSFLGLLQVYLQLPRLEGLVLIVLSVVLLFMALIYFIENFSKLGREKIKRLEQVKELPDELLISSKSCVKMGYDPDLKATIYLPDSIRSRHIHIIGATGSGKTESVILNFLKQDVDRGFGSIILDAKGDASFLWSLEKWVPKENLLVFDLSSEMSLSYNPLEAGSALESAQRLFSSFIWSEEYYKNKALSALQVLFQNHYKKYDCNPTIADLNNYLDTAENYKAAAFSNKHDLKLVEKEFADLSGLRSQLKSLSIGHLEKILSPEGNGQINLNEAKEGKVIYFRLQSLISPQIVAVLGKLVINHLNYLAGTAHREGSKEKQVKLIPTYLDEFASFACPEFADLISKARSAGIALHFSHQSIGDLAEISKGFLNQITDNSATKIVLRINDPDSADFFARSFGTKLYQKITQRVTNSEELDLAEVLGEGSQREAHQFRAPPDLLKTLPTGEGSVLIAHGLDTPHGASSVFKIKFPRISDTSSEDRTKNSVKSGG